MSICTRPGSAACPCSVVDIEHADDVLARSHRRANHGDALDRRPTIATQEPDARHPPALTAAVPTHWQLAEFFSRADSVSLGGSVAGAPKLWHTVPAAGAVASLDLDVG